MNSNTKIIMLLGVTLFFMLIGGMILGLKISPGSGIYNDEENVIHHNEENDNDKRSQVDIYDDVPAFNETKNITVIYEDVYNLCGETVKEEKVVEDATIEKLKEEEEKNMKENEKSYELKSQTSDTLVYTRTLDKYCPNHFLIKLEDSKVIVYNLVNDIVKTKYKEIEVSIELLRQEMVDELSVGIKVDSKEELNFILEDLDS